MKQFDLEQYKKAWNDQPVAKGIQLSRLEIQRFMHASSQDLLTQFKRSLIFDLALKGSLLILLVILAVLMPLSASWLTFCIVLAATLIATVALQVRTIRNIPQANPGSLDALSRLRQYLTFYHEHYARSIHVSALSGVYFFIIGALFYYYYKYSEIPSLEIFDIAILGGIVVFNFIFSSFAQRKPIQFQIAQLDKRIREIEADSLTEESLTTYQNKKKGLFFIIGLLFILGLLLLMCVLYLQMH